MAVTPTARLALNTWPLGTDPYRREQRNADAAKLDDLVAIDGQGTLAARPAAGVRGRYYFVTTGAEAGRLFRDDGATWVRIAGDADTLDGLDSSAFLPAGGTAANSDKLGGVSAPLYLLTSDANAAYVAKAGGSVSRMTGDLLLTNNKNVSFRNGADSNEIPAINVNASDALLLRGGALSIDSVGKLTLLRDFVTPYAGVEPTFEMRLTTKNSGPVTERRAPLLLQISDAPGTNRLTVTGATNASPIVITTAAAHGYATGNRITVEGVTGNTAANGIWTITVLSTTTFSLNGSVGNGAFISGGFATNVSMMSGLIVNVGANQGRGGLTGAAENGDDANGVTVQNTGTAIATDAFYIADSPGIAGDAWATCFTHDGRAIWGLRLNGTYSAGAAFLGGALHFGPPGGATSDVRIRRTGAALVNIDNGTAGAVTLSVTGTLELPNNPASGTDSGFVLGFNTLGSRRVSCGAADSAGVGFRLVRITN